jgi:aquaporin TIP
MPANRLQIAVAEFIGTFTLTFAGVLSLSASSLVGGSGPESVVSVALAHGLALVVMIAALGAISGGHFNPAVTFGFLVTGRMNPITAVVYWIAQLAGSTAAAGLLMSMAGMDTVLRGAPGLAENVGVGMGLVLEAVATFFLVLVVFGTAVDERAPKSVYPFAIGLTVTLGILAIGPITGAALNPARAFGPAIVVGEFTRHWIYWLGPMIGGALGAGVQHFLLMQHAPSPEVAAHGGPAPSEKRR